jgi:hypothetical protein
MAHIKASRATCHAPSSDPRNRVQSMPKDANPGTCATSKIADDAIFPRGTHPTLSPCSRAFWQCMTRRTFPSHLPSRPRTARASRLPQLCTAVCHSTSPTPPHTLTCTSDPHVRHLSALSTLWAVTFHPNTHTHYPAPKSAPSLTSPSSCAALAVRGRWNEFLAKATLSAFFRPLPRCWDLCEACSTLGRAGQSGPTLHSSSRLCFSRA